MGDAAMALLAGHGVFVLGGSARAVHQRRLPSSSAVSTRWYARAAGVTAPRGFLSPSSTWLRRATVRVSSASGRRRSAPSYERTLSSWSSSSLSRDHRPPPSGAGASSAASSHGLSSDRRLRSLGRLGRLGRRRPSLRVGSSSGEDSGSLTWAQSREGASSSPGRVGPDEGQLVVGVACIDHALEWITR